MSLMWQSSAKRVCMPANARLMFSAIIHRTILYITRLSLQAFLTNAKKIVKFVAQISRLKANLILRDL